MMYVSLRTETDIDAPICKQDCGVGVLGVGQARQRNIVDTVDCGYWS